MDIQNGRQPGFDHPPHTPAPDRSPAEPHNTQPTPEQPLPRVNLDIQPATPPPATPPEAGSSQPNGNEQPLPDLNLGDTAFALKSPAQPKRRRWSRWRKAAVGSGVFAILAVIVAGGAFWHLQRSIIVDNHGTGAASLQEEVTPGMLEGEGDGRVNTLLMGMDTDVPGGVGLTDVIMLASFDPVAKDVVMLSIPRDMYVELAEFGSSKINAAYVYGEQQEYPGGGPGLLKDTLENKLGVPIHYHAQADFSGFERAVDSIGGVTVDVEEPLNDPYYPSGNGGHSPFSVEAGEQTMDGATALRYVRSRKTTSDFDRNRRQQQILLALRQKVISRGTLANPARVTRLLQTMGDSVQTDMSVDEMLRLAELAEDVSGDDITQAQLTADEDNYLTFSNMYGQSVLVPTSGDFDEIRKYVRSLLVDGYIKDEGARISILNGTHITGAAETTANILRSYGYDVVNIDNASDQDYEQTVIFNYNSDKPYTLRYLENRFDVRARRQQADADAPEYDIEIVIGSDYEAALE